MTTRAPHHAVPAGPAAPRAAAPAPALVATLAAALALGACASVPDVESRLAQLRFYPNMYVVQAGDTLETIAFRYRLEPAELAALNPGSADRLLPGTRINVRPGTELPDEVRAAARVARAPETMARSPAAAAAATAAGAPARPAAAPTVIAERPAAVATAPAPVPAPAPAREPELIVESASFDPVTGGAPNEEVVPDDLDGYVPSAPADAASGLASADAAAAGGGWTWPTEGAVARGFAPGRIGGQGIDIAGVPGQDVRAAASGTVVYSGRDLSGGGNLVILRHAGDLMTTYSHADKLFVTEDDTVRAGDPIASLGWNAERESVLRFEVRRDGEPLDPLGFVSERR